MSQDVCVPEQTVIPAVKMKVKVRKCLFTVFLSGLCSPLALEITKWCLLVRLKPSFDLCLPGFIVWSHDASYWDKASSVTSLKFVRLPGFPSGWQTFPLIYMQSKYFAMLFVVCPSGAFRATLSCSLRPSERSLSSQTSRLSLHISMICMRIPELSLEDRCVCKPWLSHPFFHPHPPVLTVSD